MGGLLGGLLGGLGGFLGGSATKSAADANRRQLSKLLNNGTAYIDQGHDEAAGNLGAVGDLWKNYTDQTGGLSGLNLLGDALGVNGAEGNANATSAFQTSPGYDFQLNSGLDALSRSAAAQGRLSSGQTGLDTVGYASGLANSEYQNWLSNLSGYGGQQAGLYTTGTQGQAGSLNDLANLATNTTNQRLDLYGNYTNGIMGANNQTAAGKQQQLSGLGGLGYGLGSIGGSGGLGSLFSGFL